MAASAGNLIVISAPSGAGKTSLVAALITRMDNIAASVSHTTRPRRPTETDDEDYFFIDEATFAQLVADGEFLEYAEVFGKRYGTSKAQIQRSLDTGIDLLLEIDWQGARNIRRAYPEAVSIFIVPPSEAALRERLVGRGGDDPAVIEERMQAAMSEMSHFDEYEFLVINDDFAQAVDDLCVIVRACRLKTATQRQRLDLGSLMASADSV
jgi:guanylate kinase